MRKRECETQARWGQVGQNVGVHEGGTQRGRGKVNKGCSIIFTQVFHQPSSPERVGGTCTFKSGNLLFFIVGLCDM